MKLKNPSEMIGTVIASENHGNVKVIGFKEENSWGGLTNIYLDRFHMDSVIGSFQSRIVGGALLVEKTTEPETEFPN